MARTYQYTARCDTGAWATRNLVQLDLYGVAKIKVWQAAKPQNTTNPDWKSRCTWTTGGGDALNWDRIKVELRKKYGGTVVDRPARLKIDLYYTKSAGGSGAGGSIPDQTITRKAGSTQTWELRAPADLAAPIEGWKEGKSVAIGSPLPHLDYTKRGIFRDDQDAQDLPPVIMGSDYAFPPPLAPLEVAIAMGVSREDSKATEFIEELKAYGIGIGPGDMDVIGWADQISQDWYGMPYEDLHKSGRPDLIADHKRRNNIRAAMATKSWPAWMAMQSAQLQDTEHLSGIGAVTTEVIASTTGALAAALSVACPICSIVLSIVAIVYGVVNKVLLLASADTMEDLQRQIAASPAQLNISDKAAACAIATLALDANQAYLRAQGGVNVAVADASRTIVNEIAQRPDNIPILFEGCAAVEAAFPDAFPPPFILPQGIRDKLATRGGFGKPQQPSVPSAATNGSDTYVEEDVQPNVLPWVLGGSAATILGVLLLRRR